MALWQLGKVHLVWETPGPTQGLEITMRRRPLDEVTNGWLTADQNPTDRRPWADLTAAERVEQTRAGAAELAALIVDWNLDDGKGQPARISAKALLARCDFNTINEIWTKYAEATTRVAPPLPSSSDGGQPSEETALQLPMEPLSDSPPPPETP